MPEEHPYIRVSSRTGNLPLALLRQGFFYGEKGELGSIESPAGLRTKIIERWNRILDELKK